MLPRVSWKPTFYSCRGYAVILVILNPLCSINLRSRYWSVFSRWPFFWLPWEDCRPHGPHCRCSVIKSCDPMESSAPGFPVLRYLPELAQTHVHRVGDAVQPPHLVLSSSPPALNLSQRHGER